MELVFASKRDAWIVAVIWIGTAAMLAGAGAMLASPGPIAARVALAGFLLLAGVFSLWVTYATRYVVTAEKILVHCGPLRWHIPLAAVASIVPTRNPASSPAVSLDRLQIVYAANGGERAMLIAPADKAAFLAAVAAHCPSLVLDGDRLVPRA